MEIAEKYQHLSHYIEQMRCPPYDHQLVGITRLIERPIFALFDEPGAGKTKQVIDAAQILFYENVIDTVIIIAPASVRGVWVDQELGELRKHLWLNTPTTVTEYHQKLRRWRHGPDAPGRRLNFIVTNYDYIRQPGVGSNARRWLPGAKLSRLLEFTNRRTMLVLDESSAVKSYKAQQTRACRALRERSGRIVPLNGTPIENSPGDLYSQAFIMDPNILNCPTWLHFRSRYAIVTAHKKGFDQIVGWQNLEDLRERLRPYVLRRLKKDCLDLPPKLPPVPLTVALTPQTWRLYKQMRDELVAWLSDQSVSISAQAGVKIMRLAQMVSGFIGGVVELDNDEVVVPESTIATEGRPSWLPFQSDQVVHVVKNAGFTDIAASELKDIQGIAQVGREKVDLFLNWLDLRLQQEPNIKVIVWCRFRVELYRLKAELERRGDVLVAGIHGAQKREERERALRLLHPESAPNDKPVVVLGTLGTGARGLNLTASHTVVYMSNDFRYGTYVQSEERVHRPGQTSPVEYFDVIATGPDGQRTVDHILLAARERKENLARWTTAAWVAELTKDYGSNVVEQEQAKVEEMPF